MAVELQSHRPDKDVAKWEKLSPEDMPSGAGEDVQGQPHFSRPDPDEQVLSWQLDSSVRGNDGLPGIRPGIRPLTDKGVGIIVNEAFPVS